MSHSHGQMTLGNLGRVPSPDYVRREPEKSVLYQTVANHLNTFLATVEMEGKRLPFHVTEEFEAFLRCGVLAYGFLRLRCEGCKHERLVAFSCKKRGVCSSCGGRRMAETAANLVDHVFPKVGVRQWVLSFPFQVRFLLARDSKLQSACLEIVLRAITSFLKKKAKKQGARGKLQTGAITLIQRFGGSINLNPHFHMLVLDGAYAVTEAGKIPQFHWIDHLSDEEVAALVKTIAIRIVRYLKRQGHFRDDSEYLAQNSVPEDEIFPELQAASVQSKIALGERKGQYVRRLGRLELLIGGKAETTAPLCAEIQGFSLHAGVHCAPYEREKLEKLARYVARPAVAEDRLRVTSKGEITYRLKKPYTDGTTHLIFSPLEFMEKLAALVPRPRGHLVRYHGCLGPHAKIRSLIVPEKPKTAANTTAPQPVGQAKPRSRIKWIELLARVFAIDMKVCPNCGGDFKPIAAILETKVIVRILDHLGLPSRPPPIAPARYSAAFDHCQA